MAHKYLADGSQIMRTQTLPDGRVRIRVRPFDGSKPRWLVLTQEEYRAQQPKFR